MSIAVVAAVASVAVAAGSLAYGIASAPGSPGAAPPPPNSTQYGDDGEIISSQTYDSKTNTWITKGANAEPDKPGDNATQAEKDAYQVKHDKWATDKAARDAEKQKLSDLRTKMLDNLNTTPEDRQKAYAEYQQAYADKAKSITDPAFDKMGRENNEQANATGMFGSRAYVDTQAELSKAKLTQDEAISNQAVMAGEQLASNDRQFYANMLNQIDSGARSDTLAAAQVAQNTSNIGSQQYAGTLAQYNANNAINQQQQARSASYVSSGSNLAGGLMYLYGNKSSSGSGTSLNPSGSGVSAYGQKFSLMN